MEITYQNDWEVNKTIHILPMLTYTPKKNVSDKHFIDFAWVIWRAWVEW